MKSPLFSQPLHVFSGFALISVLALVSLAAMTATAFLASARLERLATRPLSQTIQLEWALAAGEKCAEQSIDDACEPAQGSAKNFVTTLWRGTNATDFTNETGYLLIGEPNANNNVRWTYWAGFSTAGMTNFTNTVISNAISFVNTHQGTFSNDCSLFMRNATNGFTLTPTSTNKVCTTIELLDGQASPPVGWVYLTQRKRATNSLTEVVTPVARVAWFAEDLSGKIDAERMGALSANRGTGTNPEEICLTSLIRTNGSAILTNSSYLTNANSRKLFLTPGLLAPGLTNQTDQRYFTSGLREFRPTNTVGGTNGYLGWIPSGIPITISGTSTNPYSMSGFSKASLNDFLALPPSSSLPNIANFIRQNLPNFTNRAGGMNGTIYALALAANIIDYADTDSVATSTNISGTSIVGFDNYPMLTHVFDEFLYSAATRRITITTYLQFWNPSSVSTPTISGGSFSYTMNDTLFYANGAIVTNSKLTNAILQNSNFTFGPVGYSFPANSGYITSIINTIDLSTLPNFPTIAPDPINLNTSAAGQLTARNKYTLIISGTTNVSAMDMNRYDRNLDSGTPTYIGTILGLRIATNNGNFPWRTADPRMTPYLGAGSGSAYDECAQASTYFKGYPAQDLPSGPLYANPMNWPDGYNTTNDPTPIRGTNNTGTPPTGSFTITNSLTLADPAPCKISNLGSYTNICELGNIFDPIQWAPPNTITNYANCDINRGQGSTWTTNHMYGGGSTLRIGRPEHSLFAFTNFANSGIPIPNMGQSAAALLDLFCVTNGNANGGPFRTGGKININTAPYPVLAALAGGITPTKDQNQVGSTVNTNMINAFATGVMKFRQLYPFLTPSQLLFISVNYGAPGWTNSGSWSNAAVFSKNQGLTGVTRINDEGLEEWFSKIYELSAVSSDNYRVYVVAQLVDKNSDPIGPKVRKYVHFANRPNTTTQGITTNTTYGVKMYNWALTKTLKKTYESPY